MTVTRKMHPDWAAKTAIQELVDGIVGNAGPRPPEGFRQDVEDALARAIEIEIGKRAGKVGSRHPTVVKWRNDGIEVCAGIADSYGMDFAARDMRARMPKRSTKCTPIIRASGIFQCRLLRFLSAFTRNTSYIRLAILMRRNISKTGTAMSR